MQSTKISLVSTLIALMVLAGVLIGVGLFGFSAKPLGVDSIGDPSAAQIGRGKIFANVFIAVGVLILPLALFFCKTSIEFNSRGIQINKLFSSQRYPWDRIRQIRFDKFDYKLGRGAGVMKGMTYAEKTMIIVMDDKAVSVNAMKRKKKLKAAARQWIHMITPLAGAEPETYEPSYDQHDSNASQGWQEEGEEDVAEQPAPPITLDASAVAKVQRLQQEFGENLVLRVGVKPVDDSGAFEYDIALTEEWNEQEDWLFDAGGVWVVVAHEFLDYLTGTVISYAREGNEKGFVFANPNAIDVE